MITPHHCPCCTKYGPRPDWLDRPEPWTCPTCSKPTNGAIGCEHCGWLKPEVREMFEKLQKDHPEARWRYEPWEESPVLPGAVVQSVTWRPTCVRCNGSPMVLLQGEWLCFGCDHDRYDELMSPGTLSNNETIMIRVFNIKTGGSRSYNLPAKQAVIAAFEEDNPFDGLYSSQAIPMFTAFPGSEADPAIGVWKVGDWIAVGESGISSEAIEKLCQNTEQPVQLLYSDSVARSDALNDVGHTFLGVIEYEGKELHIFRPDGKSS